LDGGVLGVAVRFVADDELVAGGEGFGRGIQPEVDVEGGQRRFGGSNPFAIAARQIALIQQFKKGLRRRSIGNHDPRRQFFAIAQTNALGDAVLDPDLGHACLAAQFAAQFVQALDE